MLRGSLYLILASVILVACNDHLKTDANNDPQGYADSQVVGSWKITAFYSNAPYDWNRDGNIETDIYNTWSACEKDNLYTFVGDKTGTFKISCVITRPGSWTIINTKQLVYQVDGIGAQSEKITYMSSDLFKTTIEVTVITGEDFTITKIWERQ